MEILAINPWIYDFAAYDFWLKPYGFLVLLSYLAKKGLNIDYIDCLDKKEFLGSFGRGKYPAEIIKKPEIFKSIPRHFKRYGIALSEFLCRLARAKPDYILITSSMTYWYPAIKDIAHIVKEKFPKTPLIIGGTYTSLCYEHAQRELPCDLISKNSSLKEFFSYLGLEFNEEEFYSTLPQYDNFYTHLDYVVLRTSWGCPFNCSYCAINTLQPKFFKVPLKNIVEYILSYYRKGICDFILYDDAFLYDQQYCKNLLKEIVRSKIKVRFHTPNALHLRFLDAEIAQLLKKSGFINPHFGLETLQSRLQKLWGDKVNRDDLINGISLLKKGGFKNGEFSVYLLLGYPGQDLKNLKEEALFINSLGAKVSLAEFSPVPHTEIFKHYKKSFSEPLLHNNSVFGFFRENKMREFWDTKNYVRQLNKDLRNNN
ncbi:MAG: radical SAM protein [Candidatus Omnitrophota bacterium]|nr:MAG: radical SAM protein [Candidatus Omnitrophota bacterium]